MMLLDASALPSLPTITLPPGAPPWLLALTIVVPSVVYVLWLFRHPIGRLGEREPEPARAASDPCADCAALRGEVTQLKQAIESAHKGLHHRLREIDDGPLDLIQRTASAAGTSAAEAKAAISEDRRDLRHKLDEIEKGIVRLLDRSDREPTR